MFDGHEAEGYVVGINKSKYGYTTAWFKPDDGFSIPADWDRSDEFPGAFDTAIEYLTEVYTTEDIPDIDPNEIEVLLNV